MKGVDRPGRAGLRRFRGCSAALFAVMLLLCPTRLLSADPVRVLIVGLEGTALKNVQAALAIPPGLVREGRVDLLWLDRFAAQAEENARRALEPFGYYRAKVKVVTEKPEEGSHLLRVEISPGNAVRVEEVKVAIRGSGSQEAPLQEMAGAFPLQKGDVLLHPLYERAKAALQGRAQEMGYRDAHFSVHEIIIDESLSTSRIGLVLETGDQHRFGKLTIQGAPDYPETFLQRYVTFRTGEIFSPARLVETQRNYLDSERFREARVVPGESESPGNTVPVTVELTQAPFQSLRTGLGYGTDTGARFTVRYRDLNLFSRGHEISENLFISERLQGLASTYIIHGIPDAKSFFSAQINLQQEDIDAYRSRLVSSEFSLNRSFRAKMIGAVYLRLLYEDSTLGEGNSRYFSVLPGLRLTDDHYDHPTHPRSGFRYMVEVRGTHETLGSEMGLFQGIAEGSRLTPLPWSLTLHTRAAAALTILSDPVSQLPPSLRFFAGGDQSVRGYAYKSLAPRDQEGDLAGGKHLLSGSVELERALYKDWSVSVFYDAGNAFDSFSSFRLHQGAGVGVHYYTPVGALNFSIARQIGKDDPSYRIHFTVGFQL